MDRSGTSQNMEVNQPQQYHGDKYVADIIHIKTPLNSTSHNLEEMQRDILSSPFSH